MPPVHFDWTISLGQVVTAASFFLSIAMAGQRIYLLLDKRLSLLQQTVMNHTDTLTSHDSRMKHYEEVLFKVVSDLQRLIGRAEAYWVERRHTPPHSQPHHSEP